MSILVVGALHLDVVVDAPRLPALDETVTGSGVSYVFGGKGGNQALAAARMGAEVHFTGRAGSDGFGDMIRTVFDDSPVDTSQLQQDAGPSGMSTAIVDAQGDYGAVIVSAANLNIASDAISVPVGCELVLLQNEIPEAVNIAVAQKARAAGADVWLNAAPARELPAALADLVDLLIVNRVEATFYEGRHQGADRLTTLGAQGVSYLGDRFAGYPVEVVSTHGAGDAFVGALAAEIANGCSVARAIPFAQAAAALHVATPVVARGAIDRAAVAAFLDAQDNL